MTCHFSVPLLLVGGVILAGPARPADPPPPPAGRDAKFKALVETVNAEAMEKRLALNRAANADLVNRAWPLVEADPKDEVAFKICRVTLAAYPAGHPVRTKGLALIREHHLGRPDLDGMFAALATDGEGRDFLRTALDTAPDKHTRAMACYHLALGPLAPGAPKPPAGTAAGRDAAAERDTYLKRLEADFPAERSKKGQATLVDVARGLILADSLVPGKPAPAAECPALDGTPARLADLKGKVVVLDFWATWCGPCKAMIPHQRKLVERLKAQPFALVSVSADEKKETLTEFLKETPMPWVHWFSGLEGLAARWGVHAYPTVYVVDRKGVIRYKDVRGDKLDAAVDELLKEAR